MKILRPSLGASNRELVSCHLVIADKSLLIGSRAASSRFACFPQIITDASLVVIILVDTLKIYWLPLGPYRAITYETGLPNHLNYLGLPEVSPVLDACDIGLYLGG